jgi:hypothetical protein
MDREADLRAMSVTDDQARQHYNANRAQFVQPQRFRASHLFLAAPKGHRSGGPDKAESD